MDMYGFYTGKTFDAYEYLGCNYSTKATTFRTFAPAAEKISVIGDFNAWQETEMKKVYDGNFWEVIIQNVKPGERYKYRIYEKGGKVLDHADPYGYGMELRPNTASIVRDMSTFHFTDSKWMRKRTDRKNKPLNIYEIHAGSWKKKTETETGWYTYAELAKQLVPYVKEQGYNYVELMPVAEHPSDNSWGYQSTGFYSPTSRYGTADDLKEFINVCHKNNVGVILDFVPVHFAVDDYGLANYDGTALYEYPSADVGNSEWGSKNFIHSRGEVQSFLQSNANYWVKEYHFDGLRMDAISNMIYWQGNKERGVNQNAVAFIQHMNKGLKEKYPSVILCAEDSTAFPKVTECVENGGLGFDYKWDMGWMNDTLSFMQTTPDDRSRDYHKLTFSMEYFYDEHFLLPFSHDEVVHGKSTIVQKMNGEYMDKFAQAKTLYLYMYTHPGKKLNFMGNEIGQMREWDEKRQQDFELLKYPVHDSFAHFIKDLNHIYLENAALYEKDFEREGFEWVQCQMESECIYSYKRKGKMQQLLVILNFSNEGKDDSFKIDKAESCEVLLSTDAEKYGGKAMTKIHRNGNKVKVSLAPFSSLILKFHRKGEMES